MVGLTIAEEKIFSIVCKFAAKLKRGCAR